MSSACPPSGLRAPSANATACRVGEYGRRARIEWAAAQIAAGDRPLAEIAAEAGFADQSHFTRLFRRYLGTTPGRFRAFQSR